MKQVIFTRSWKHREAEETAWMRTDICRSRDSLGVCKESRAKCQITKASRYHVIVETKTLQLARHSCLLLELFHQIWYFNTQSQILEVSTSVAEFQGGSVYGFGFEFHIISISHENTIHLFFVSPSSKNVKIILHKPYKNQVQIRLAHGL